ncbi:hypothetical protein R6Q59_034049 [Mikania micrantha]|uniref:Uncharacterized protein n=1 Tax=Mikania micrantha TaxID=192012 RepID=A0A5N6NJ27_9ASTR|nr:hypothetical protein E3N88_21135 [Mikania micrantha]
MLGRVRACSLSSLEVLEMERTPSKLLKDDSLSIYEKTLLKLQQGSQHNLNSIPDESTNLSTSSSMSTVTTNEASMTENAADCASTSLGNNQSTIISKDEPRGNLSIFYMFSRYKASRNDAIISSDDSTMAMEDCCSSANTSSSHDLELHEGCIVDLPSPI